MAQEDLTRQQEFNKVNIQQVRLIPLDADPVDLVDGDVWHRGDTDSVHIQLNGVRKTFTVT